ncbi:MAG: ribosomal protein S18-alanine N-acetyltransferase [Betaproteobacteria bacterium]
MSALATVPQVELQTMTQAWLDEVAGIEKRAYTHPWSRGNFSDSLRAGYHAQVLTQEQAVLGYHVLMLSPGEAHLLNITVDPQQQGRGLALIMLNALAQWSQAQGAQSLWLEVRVGNARARQIYERYGFKPVGLRKNYYPLAPFKREDAVVMSLPLSELP